MPAHVWVQSLRHCGTLLLHLRRDPRLSPATVAPQPIPLMEAATGYPPGAVCSPVRDDGSGITQVWAILLTALTIVARELTEPLTGQY
jgi:hypothetical protein